MKVETEKLKHLEKLVSLRNEKLMRFVNHPSQKNRKVFVKISRQESALVCDCITEYYSK